MNTGLIFFPKIAFRASTILKTEVETPQATLNISPDMPLADDALIFVSTTLSTKVKKAKFLLASTSEVYGDPLEHPQKESYWGNVNPIGPRGVYDEAKRFAEAITMAYHNTHKIDTKIARIFNTYGEGMRWHDGRAVPTFISQALKGRPITVFGNGKQTRSFCYISDLIDGIYKLLKSNIHNPVNIGNPHEFSILQLVHLVVKLTKSKSKIVFKKLPADDPKIRKPDITMAKSKLKWKPTVSLKEGLVRAIEYFKKR